MSSLDVIPLPSRNEIMHVDIRDKAAPPHFAELNRKTARGLQRVEQYMSLTARIQEMETAISNGTEYVLFTTEAQDQVKFSVNAPVLASWKKVAFSFYEDELMQEDHTRKLVTAHHMPTENETVKAAETILFDAHSLNREESYDIQAALDAAIDQSAIALSEKELALTSVYKPHGRMDTAAAGPSATFRRYLKTPF